MMLAPQKHWVCWAYIGGSKHSVAEWMPSIKLYSVAQVAEWIAQRKAEEFRLQEVVTHEIDLSEFLARQGGSRSEENVDHS